MRVRNNKNQLFEKEVIEKTHVNIFIPLMIIGMYMGLSILIYTLGKNTLGGYIFFWTISIMVFFIINGLLKGKFSETVESDSYTKIKKGKKTNFLIDDLKSIEVKNNSNYFFSEGLEKKFKKQVIHPFIICVISGIVINIPIAYKCYMSASIYTILALLLCLAFFAILSFATFKNFRHIKRILKERNICILRRDIGSYYIYKDWIYFY